MHPFVCKTGERTNPETDRISLAEMLKLRPKPSCLRLELPGVQGVPMFLSAVDRLVPEYKRPWRNGMSMTDPVRTRSFRFWGVNHSPSTPFGSRTLSKSNQPF